MSNDAEQATPQPEQPIPLHIAPVVATEGAGVGEVCDLACEKPIMEGQEVVRGTPTSGEGPTLWAHELCWLRRQYVGLRKALQETVDQLGVAQRWFQDCHNLLACVVAANGGRARVRPVDIARAAEARFELSITDTEEKDAHGNRGKKLVLTRAPVIVAPAGFKA